MIRTLLIVLSLAAQGWAQGYVCAEGGGNAGKGAWADEVFGWMVEKGQHGKVVIIGAVKLDEDERVGLFTRLGAKSVESLVVTQENADTQATYDAIAAASVVFIRGGSQSRYVQWWKGTRTQAAIEAVFKKGGVVAGTSAGCAVLGEVDYDAIHGSLSAREALADGRHENLSLTTGFLDFVPGVLFDTHFTERGRLARLPVMLAHCKTDLKKDDILGIGVDPRTAVCVGPDGIAEIRGEGTATLLRLSTNSEIRLEQGKPPTVTAVQYTQLFSGHRFNVKDRALVFRPEWIERSEYSKCGSGLEQRPPVLVVGSKLEDAALGALHLTVQPDDVWLHGPPATERGRDELPCAAVAARAFSDKNTANSMAGVQDALATAGVRVGYWLDETAQIQAVDRRVDVLTAESEPRSVLMLDSTGAKILGRGPAARQRPVIEEATLYVLAPGWSFDRDAHLALPTEKYPRPLEPTK